MEELGRLESNNNECREYEVEVRSNVLEADFDSILDRLTILFGKPMVVEMKTFLFRNSDTYARIRIIKGSDYGVLTEKIGDYTDKAREEINREFSFDEVDNIIKELEDKRLIDCSYIISTRYDFLGPDDQKISLSKHGHLGNLLEVEALTKDQSKIEQLHVAVSRTLVNLGQCELSATDYQSMMDQMFTKTLRSVFSYKEKISYFK